MATLSKKFTFKRKVTFAGIGEKHEDVAFEIVFNGFDDDEQAELLTAWSTGMDEKGESKIAEAQKAALDKIIKEASCSKYFPGNDADARDFLVNGNFAMRTALRFAYTRALFSGGLLEGN